MYTSHLDFIDFTIEVLISLLELHATLLKVHYSSPIETGEEFGALKLGALRHLTHAESVQYR